MQLFNKNKTRITLFLFLIPFLAIVGISIYKTHRVQIGLEENPLLPNGEVIYMLEPAQPEIPEPKKVTPLPHFRKHKPISSEEIELPESNIEVESDVIDAPLDTETPDPTFAHHSESIEIRVSKDSLTPNQRIYRGKVFTKVK